MFHDPVRNGVLPAVAAWTIHTGSAGLQAFLFNEEPGIVLQVRTEHVQTVRETLLQSGLPEACLALVANPNGGNESAHQAPGQGGLHGRDKSTAPALVADFVPYTDITG